MLVYLIAGESSGDVLGARLMAAILALRPDATFRGVGGPAMAALGLQSRFPMRDLAVMGFAEVLPKIRTLRARILETVADIGASAPDVVVTIDSPGFALRVLRRVPGVRRVQYVAPQLWAWRPGRAKALPGLWDRLLCLLPFEPAFFAGYGIAAEFVGHPVLEGGADRGDAARFRARHGVAADETVLLVMPGSRRNEVREMLPLFGRALAGLPVPVRPVVAVAEPVAEAVLAGVADWPGRPVVVTEPGDKFDAFAQATAALVKSGTSSLEVALSGTPMVVAYRANPLTAVVVRRLVRVRYASIVNLIADAPVIPELIQGAATPGAIVAALTPLLSDPAARAAQVAGFGPALASLRAPMGTPSAAAARAVLEVAMAGRTTLPG